METAFRMGNTSSFSRRKIAGHPIRDDPQIFSSHHWAIGPWFPHLNHQGLVLVAMAPLPTSTPPCALWLSKHLLSHGGCMFVSSKTRGTSKKLIFLGDKILDKYLCNLIQSNLMCIHIYIYNKYIYILYYSTSLSLPISHHILSRCRIPFQTACSLHHFVTKITIWTWKSHGKTLGKTSDPPRSGWPRDLRDRYLPPWRAVYLHRPTGRGPGWEPCPRAESEIWS